MNEESRWDLTERGVDAAEGIQATRLEVVPLPLAPRRRDVSRADLRKYGVTIGCAACSDIAVHGKTANLTQNDVGQRLPSK